MREFILGKNSAEMERAFNDGQLCEQLARLQDVKK